MLTSLCILSWLLRGDLIANSSSEPCGWYCKNLRIAASTIPTPNPRAMFVSWWGFASIHMGGLPHKCHLSRRHSDDRDWLYRVITGVTRASDTKSHALSEHGVSTRIVMHSCVNSRVSIYSIVPLHNSLCAYIIFHVGFPSPPFVPESWLGLFSSWLLLHHPSTQDPSPANGIVHIYQPEDIITTKQLVAGLIIH